MASRRSLRGLDGVNVFLADVQTGVGPFVAIILASGGWNANAIGIALTVGGLAAVLIQMPVGAWVDAAHGKRGILAMAIVATAVSAAVLALTSNEALVLGAQGLHGAATGVMGPVVIAISLGLVGHRGLGERLGRNHRFDAAGNLSAAALMGVVGYVFAPVAIFWVTVMLAVPALVALSRIEPKDIDHAAARGTSPKGAPVRFADLRKNRRLLVLLACAVLFHLANGAMLPLLGTMLVRGRARHSSLLVSLCIMTTQVVVLLVAPWCGRQAGQRGRKPMLLVGFGVLPVRAVLYALTTSAPLLIGIQILDGIAAAIFATVAPLVVADVTKGTGRGNVAQGALGMAVGVGGAMSNAMAGAIADRYGNGAGFVALAAVAVAAFAVLLTAMPETRPEVDEQATPP
ncbi:MAG TPA: MFS transporter, partial [Polyangiaceae bacterium]|nr:MFS transporter [Polyangiaceae bacterium]